MYQCFNRIDTGIEIQSLLLTKLLNNPGLGKSVHSLL
jgi:hypothetical protein